METIRIRFTTLRCMQQVDYEQIRRNLFGKSVHALLKKKIFLRRARNNSHIHVVRRTIRVRRCGDQCVKHFGRNCDVWFRRLLKNLVDVFILLTV